MLPWQQQIRQLNYQKTDVHVVNLLSAIFGDQRIKGFREKGEWAQVSNTVFSHLNFKRSIEHYCSTQARCSRRLELACVKTHIVYPVFPEDKFGINYDKYF